ncbi:unnamed protein product [Cylicocyclus nassatus]|uniref:SWIM-type domain-containing protein n=1 Tax=Cylicocyclus nassatus TaxID=53992 RepID=A0AA36H409_CYLNA|nr:unnamed protein product [Cylicocyclus nassatus]
MIENLRRRKKSLDNVFTLRRIAQDRWTIEFEDTSYTITNSTYTCSLLRKGSHCSLCGLCPYSTFCTCPDNLKSGISCKHLHYWQMQHDDSGCVETLAITACSEDAENIAPTVPTLKTNKCSIPFWLLSTRRRKWISRHDVKNSNFSWTAK